MNTLAVIALAATVASAALAGPLQKTQLPADTRWVLHADLEALLTTSVGQTLAREALDPHLAKPKADLKQHLGFEFDWRRIRSITLYGTEYSGPERLRGVVLVDTDLDVAKALESAMQKLAQAGAAENGDLQRLEDGASPLYCLKEDVYVGIQPGAPVIVGKARRTVLKAREVLVGGAANLNSVPGFADFAGQPGSFIVVAAAQGFSDAAPVPPQARVLKMAEALQMAIAESDGQVKATLALTAKTAEAARQMQQVVQGMMALGALSQVDHQDLQTLLAGLRSNLAGRVVTLELTLPAGRIAEKITEQERRKRGSN
jgi:hypothetical protein